MTASVLDDIAGLGDARRKALMRHFGSVKRMRAATVEQIQEVPGIGAALSATIARTLHDTATQPAPSVNVTTGEMLT